jgi:hypothetical protein
MPQMSKVELYAAIRRDHRGGMSIQAPWYVNGYQESSTAATASISTSWSL